MKALLIWRYRQHLKSPWVTLSGNNKKSLIVSKDEMDVAFMEVKVSKSAFFSEFDVIPR